ncbi:GDP-mannose 4,6-dehydratase [Candidatus Gugararchaeum adminiculabundum]|nr:GDP-mannose 4,6-dehydratase [Candidatus Gugararchaeum adminiculabundum]
MKILVTGGAGFIGSNFVRHMLSAHRDLEIVNLDKLTYAGNLDNLEGLGAGEESRHKFIRGDICDKKIVEQAIKGCEVVVNFAAETHVDRSISNAEDFVKTDVYGTLVLLEACRKADAKFVQISTDEVYGNAENGPSKETDELKPRSPYAASKAGADRLAFSYWATHGLPVVITRCTNNYGPNQYPEKLIPLFAINALQGKELPVYGTGKNTRDWIYVLDHCKAIERVMQEEKCFRGEVYNIGAGNELSVLEITSVILKQLGKPASLLKHVQDRPGHVVRHAVDSGKIRSELGWKPEHLFEQNIASTIEWYKSNKWWWSKLIR